MAAQDSLNGDQFEPLTHLPMDPDPPQGMWGRGPKSSEEWSSARVRKVPLASLHATQGFIESSVANEYRKGKKSRLLPKVAVEGGKHFLVDGHHRTLIAHERGETHIRAKVWEES